MAADNRISDEALVSAMAAGDQDALATLNQRYGRALSAVADRILRDQGDAEEVAADVLWQLWREASRFDRSRGSVGAWIMMTVRSRARAMRASLAATMPPRPRSSTIQPMKFTAPSAASKSRLRWRRSTTANATCCGWRTFPICRNPRSLSAPASRSAP